VTFQPSPLTRVATVAAAFAATLVASIGAAQASPCSDAILADWLDNGRIDRVYDLPCYDAAVDAIPPDLLDYTDAADVIGRAFQNATGRRLEGRSPKAPGRHRPPPPSVVPSVGTAASAAVPMPLLVLAGMSTVLLAAGGLGYVLRRRRE
jgi:hypothetical protein